MAGVRYKQQIYDRNDYAALFVYPWDLTGPAWPDRLVRRLDYAAGRRTLPDRGSGGYNGMYQAR